MRIWSLCGALCLAGLSVGCGAVPVPVETYYRLAPTNQQPIATASQEALRVEGFELASALSSDRLMVAESPVQLHIYEFHRWINPLERLVQDAIRGGLRRAGAFGEVLGPADSGASEAMTLTGRVLDFQQVPLGDGWGGRVRLELRLVGGSGQRTLLREEFGATAAMADASPAGAVQALSRATGEVLSQFLRRCAERELLGVPARPPGR